MNTEQLGSGTPSETSDSETSEPGSPAATQWGEALTDALASAGEASSSQLEVLTNWAAEVGQGQHEDRQEAVSRTRAWQDTGHVNEALDLSSLSLTALPAPSLAGLRRLNVDDNQLNNLPGDLPASLQRLYASNNQLTGLPELPNGLRRLYVISNGLTNLPAQLPPGLRRLRVDNNQLTNLPDRLPATLEELDVSGNRLTNLPDLPSRLQRLNVDYNQLTDLPEPLPGGLQWLSASHNELTSLPETVPPDLLWLGASDNQLTSVPETLLTQLGRDSSVDLENNPLPDLVQAGLAAAIHAADYAGPQVFLSTAEGALEVEPRSLQEVVADWLEAEPSITATWQGFAQEPGARDYARFLDRLRGTVNYGNDGFRQAVVEDLRQAAVRPRLREQFFQLASGASERCEDRVTLTWNGMQSARLNADVEDGVYDGRLAELLRQGRVLFRLEALDGIARETVNSLRRADPDAYVDEIEVYLAYQTQLRDPLHLLHIAPDMRFLNVSNVTEDDIARAEASVRNQEAAEFPDYLATRWHPWESVLRRIAPEDYAAMERRLVDAMGDEFQARLDRRLAENGLTGDADAERVLGAQIRKEIALEIKGPVMHQVLERFGLEL
ncbi:NEL-type E3 ubiquitin ligase domain-containing protein [Bradyrhizobium brasilense]|uniref:NEL-type E3 ubiquitin ligase domain-containing protein n=1 Tax=Bradyrhizobium brasilense TaxID=1419277 RepID=UPI0024B16BF5|nr:NEL-type E3 ubiquitin ligase domain-containing protein [Bradyrhizobium australafricanum]WFU31581.1 NEL-type E3 ubiquitin ligase domain-containing protein [Bradyrhizobium australafricanum]